MPPQGALSHEELIAIRTLRNYAFLEIPLSGNDVRNLQKIIDGLLQRHHL